MSHSMPNHLNFRKFVSSRLRFWWVFQHSSMGAMNTQQIFASKDTKLQIVTLGE